MTHSEAIGYMAAEIGILFKEVILPCLLQKHTNRSVQNLLYDASEDMITGVLNHCEIKCHVCMEFCGWSRNLELKQSKHIDIIKETE